MGTDAAGSEGAHAVHRYSSNAANLLLGSVAWAGDRPAVSAGDLTATYDGLAARATQIARALQNEGVRDGDRVGVLLRRGVDSAATFFGVLASGAVNVTISESLRPRQIEYILRHAGAKVLIAGRDVLDRLPRPLEVETPVLDVAETVDDGHAALVPAAPKTAWDLAQIVYTSGSTGMPKGVAVSHGNLWAGTDAVVEYLGLRKEDRLASLLPFSFDYGLNQLLCAVRTGACLVVENTTLPQRIVRSLEAQEVTVLPAVPPLWLQLLHVRAFTSRRLPALRVMTNTGGHLPTSAVRTLRASQPQADLFLMYGLTEAFRSTYLPPVKVDHKADSIGQAIPGAQVLVVDEHGRRCGPGEVGELVHRGPTVALGYWNDRDATAARFRPNPLPSDGIPDAERVVYSGDLVRADADGDLYFVGRRDQMIKTMGHRVSPDEVSEVLHASGEVAEAVVTSEPDESRGARIVAYVVLRAGGDVERLEQFAATELPRHMQPSRIEVRESLARTASGKHDASATVASRS